MKFKATFFLLIILTSFGSSWAMQMNANPAMDCCHKKSLVTECTKPMQHEKRECNKDYCNPFLSCSTTPVIVSPISEMNAPHFTCNRTYPEMRLGALKDFSRKHWQPPKV